MKLLKLFKLLKFNPEVLFRLCLRESDSTYQQNLSSPISHRQPEIAQRWMVFQNTRDDQQWWRLLHLPQQATTTPFSYDSLLHVFMDLVSQTVQVKSMARSCLGDIFCSEEAENLVSELLIVFASLFGFELASSRFAKSSLTRLVGFVCA
ncbi:hypothetical protein ACFX13_015287 [Malus domestica]